MVWTVSHFRARGMTMTEFTLFVGHGSRDSEGNAEFIAFVDDIRRQQPESRSEVAFLELATPTIEDGVDRCVERGADRIVVVPVILLAASHVKIEIPEWLDLSRRKHPHVDIVYGRNIGLHARMVDMLAERFAHAMGEWAQEDASTTAIVLMGRGSSDADANGDVYKMARQLWERTGVLTVEVCFSGITFPRLQDGVRRAAALGAARIVVVPYFLFTGVLIKRMRGVVETLQSEYPSVPLVMAEYLGRHASLVDVVLDRRLEAAQGLAGMNCDLCKYRLLA